MFLYLCSFWIFMNCLNVISVECNEGISISVKKQKMFIWSFSGILIANPSIPLLKSENETPDLFLKSR